MIAAAVFLALLASPAPADDLIAPGAKHVQSGHMQLTTYDAPMTPTQASQFLHAVLAKRGWKAADEISYGTTITFYVNRKPHGFGSVTLAPVGYNVTHVSVSLSE